MNCLKTFEKTFTKIKDMKTISIKYIQQRNGKVADYEMVKKVNPKLRTILQIYICTVCIELRIKN